MSRIKKIKAIVIGAIVVSVGLSGYAYSQGIDPNEKEFQQIVEEIEKVILEGEKLKDQGLAEEAQPEMRQNQIRLGELMDKLIKFIAIYPNSKYTDDAAYILTFEPKDRIESLTAFLQNYPNASLESWTLERKFVSLEKDLNLLNAAQASLVQKIYDAKRYTESLKKAEDSIKSLDVGSLTDKSYDILGLSYYILMKEHEISGNVDKVREVCKEAISKLNDKNKEIFLKKLQELDSQKQN